jgi:ABC-type hemin transport system substrate-binding protein
LRNVLASVVGAMFLLALLLPPTIGSNFGVPWNTFFPTALRGHAPFKRILAGSVMSAEILLAIAPRDCIAGVHQLAADTRYSMAWEQARDCPLVGAGAEQMLAVRPDLVITDEFTRAETQSLLARAGVVVLRTPQLTYLQDVEQAPMRFAELLPEECRHKVAVIMAETELRLAALARAAPGVAGWRVMTLDGALDTYGARSLVDDVIRAAGSTSRACWHGDRTRSSSAATRRRRTRCRNGCCRLRDSACSHACRRNASSSCQALCSVRPRTTSSAQPR